MEHLIPVLWLLILVFGFLIALYLILRSDNKEIEKEPEIPQFITALIQGFLGQDERLFSYDRINRSVLINFAGIIYHIDYDMELVHFEFINSVWIGHENIDSINSSLKEIDHSILINIAYIISAKEL